MIAATPGRGSADDPVLKEIFKSNLDLLRTMPGAGHAGGNGKAKAS
jgi:hypothetical protein